MVDSGQTLPDDDPSKITIRYRAPDWLSKALADAFDQVLKEHKRHMIGGKFFDGHPWIRFFHEAWVIEQKIAKR